MPKLDETQLRNWLLECQRCDATHMLLVVDRTEDFSISPVKVLPHQNIYEMINFYSTDGNEVTEIYSMSLPLEQQLKSNVPVFNYA